MTLFWDCWSSGGKDFSFEGAWKSSSDVQPFCWLRSQELDFICIANCGDGSLLTHT